MSSYSFPYNGSVSYSEELTLESIGNTCLHVIDELDFHYFLITKTKLGVTTYLEFGPLQLDGDLLPDEYNVIFRRFEYSTVDLVKRISAFLRPKKNMYDKKRKIGIATVQEISEEELLNYGVDVFAYLKSYSDTTNY